MPSLAEIQRRLHQLATPEGKAAVKKFVPGSVRVYGVRMPLLNALSAKLKKEVDAAFIEVLWKSGSFEEKILSAKLINRIAKKHPGESIRMVQQFSNDVQDWAVCDTLGMQSLKPITGTHREEIFNLAKKLNTSKNLWQRRLSLVLVEVYAKQTELHPMIMPLLKQLENDEEYYVKKAVAWLKRNMEVA